MVRLLNARRIDVNSILIDGADTDNNGSTEQHREARGLYKYHVGPSKEISDEWQLFTITAYCGCEKCCGKTDRITATGTYAIEGVTIAVDPTVIPYGSEVDIEGIGTFVAEDCGGAIKGNKIDIYFERHEDALKFGIWEDWRVRIRE